MSNDKPEDKEQAPTERRPYEPPSIEDQAEFETLALSCGKDQPSIGACYGPNLQMS